VTINILILSKDSYLYLPNKKSPKVVLDISNSNISRKSFLLYQPFSKRAKLLKVVSRFFSIYFNWIVKFLFSYKSNYKSDFVQHIEKQIGQILHVSVYFSTAKDKTVLQLQSRNHQILGYIKLATNDIGNMHINNEINAINILSKKGIIDLDYLILEGKFERFNYCFLKELKGNISTVSEKAVLKILDTLKTDKSFKLLMHPRVMKIRNKLKEYSLKYFLTILDELIINKNEFFKIVYEHGDFAPWNLIKTEKGVTPFDFEYFEENGLEYLDLFKYYYQKATLLKGKSDHQLIKYLQSRIRLNYFKELFIIYLLKEIIIKSEECLDIKNEKKLIEILLVNKN